MATEKTNDPTSEYVEKDGDVYLVGCRCHACGFVGFPARKACPDCYEPTDQIHLDGVAKLEAHTVVHVSSPEFDTPYPFGSARLLESDSRVFSPLVGDVEQFEPGLQLRLCTTEIKQGEELWAMRPAEDVL